MANWGNLGDRGEVEDRRGLAPIVGGVSLGGVALYLLMTYLSGGSVTDALPQILNELPTENRQVLNSQDFEGEDEYEVFASTVLGSNNALWERVFPQLNRTYTAPKLVLFREATESACGGATSEVGPHYCPLDKTIYLDETFFDELIVRFGAQGGDVSQAYVIAHEVGHHVQNELSIFTQYENRRSNEMSVKIELQADCFAGIWANSIRERGVLEPGEIREAMDAAAAVGDDRIQKAVTGYSNPETWTHGSSAQRVDWFTKGYEGGNVSSCNTF
jgi:predicted metalloprotease